MPSRPDTPRQTAACSECGRELALDQVIRIGNEGVCADCKPILVQKLREGLVKQTSEEIRRSVFVHEILVRSSGLLCFAWAAIHLELVCLAPRIRADFALMAMFFLTIIGGLEICLGIGLMRLRRWARISAGYYASFGWIAIFLESPIANGVPPAPDGTFLGIRILFTGALLWLLAGRKSSVVFSGDYKRVIAETEALGGEILTLTALLFSASLGILMAILL